MSTYESFIRLVEEGQTPTRLFVITTPEGQWETDNPMYLMDIVTKDFFADCDDYPTQIIMGSLLLQNLGAALAMEGKRVQVYDALGLIWDGNSGSAEFENVDPIVLDSWDAWTVLKGLIETEQIIVHEKVPMFTAKNPQRGCVSCFFNKNGQCSVWRSSHVQGTATENVCAYSSPATEYPEYVQVVPELIADPSYKFDWVPISERKEEHEEARKSDTDRQ